MTEEAKTFLFRHKTIRRFCIEQFEFKNFELRLQSEKERDEFVAMVQDLPNRDAIQIVEVNEAAAAVAETSIAKKDSSVVRGFLNADDILTAKDRQRLQDTQGSGPQNLIPAGQKPPTPAMNLANLNLGNK
jgi:hypothetical protein